MKLFEPFYSPKLSVKNRVVMAPMTRGFCLEFIPGDDVVDYYRSRIEGGVGLIITEGTFVDHPAAAMLDNIPAFYGEHALAGWKKVADEVHRAGGKIIPQLWHAGAIRRRGVGPEPDAEAVSPSGLEQPGVANGRAMTHADIDDVIHAFARAATEAKRIGFDGVQIHGAHGYLIDQFLWEGTNQRTDEYGGSLENRLRFPLQLVKAVREVVGEDFPILFRFSQWKQQNYSAKLADTPEELARILLPLVEAGVDIFDASTRRYWEAEFEGSSLNAASWAKKLTGKPVITVGSVGLDNDFFSSEDGSKTTINKEEVTSDEALNGLLNVMCEAKTASVNELEEHLENGEFDLVAVGRALISNPDWVALIQQGRHDELKCFSMQDLLML